MLLRGVAMNRRAGLNAAPRDVVGAVDFLDAPFATALLRHDSGFEPCCVYWRIR